MCEGASERARARARVVFQKAFWISLWMKNHHSKWVRFKRKAFTFFLNGIKERISFWFCREKKQGFNERENKMQTKTKKRFNYKGKKQRNVYVCDLLLFFYFKFSAANSVELKGKNRKWTNWTCTQKDGRKRHNCWPFYTLATKSNYTHPYNYGAFVRERRLLFFFFFLSLLCVEHEGISFLYIYFH